MKTCYFCAEEIQSEAIKCKHCGEKCPLNKNTKDIWYRLIKVLYFFSYTILVGVSLVGFVLAFVDKGVNIFDGLWFTIGIIIGIIFIEITNIILIYLFKGDIKQIDYCLLKYKFKRFFILIPLLMILGIVSIGHLGINEYQEKIIQDTAYQLGAVTNNDVKKYKEFKEKYDSIKLPQIFKLYICVEKGFESLFKNIDDTSDTLTYFYGQDDNNCYLLREYNSHGGNGLISTTLYSLENNNILGTKNNHISDEIFFAGDNLVYVNKIDDLLSKINLSNFRMNYVLGNTFVKKDIMPERENTYDKVLKLRGLNNYQEKKKELYEKEERLIDETFLSQHYRSLSVGMEFNNNLGKYTKNLDELKYIYNNYMNPPVSYNTFFSWYKNTTNVSVGKISLLEDKTYQLVLTINDSIDGELKYDIKVKVKRYENGDRKIESYESKKI